MKTAAIWLFSLLIFTSPQGRSPAAVSQLEGVVLNAIGDVPVAGAQLALRPDGPPRPITYVSNSGADGHFVFKDIPAGRYRLTATRQGFIDRDYGQRQQHSKGVVLDLQSPQTLKDLTIRITPGGVITGTVTDEKGDPLEGAAVTLMHRVYQADGTAYLQAFEILPTDDLGVYRFHEVPPGSYVMVAAWLTRLDRQLNTAAFIDQSDEPQIFPPTYYPNSVDPEGASPVRVEAGAVMSGMDFSLKKTRPVLVSGVVLDGVTGRPVVGEDVNLRPRVMDRAEIRAIHDTTRTDDQGTFAFPNVVPGEYAVSVDVSQPGFHAWTATRDVTVTDRPVTEIQIIPKPYPSISGRVVFEDPDSVGANRPSLRFTNTNTASHGNEYDAGIDVDGTFSLTNLFPGVYKVSLNGMSADAFIRSASSDDQEALGRGLDIRENSAEHLQVLIGAKGGTVEGTVNTEAGVMVAGAQVLLVPDDRDRFGLFKTAITDQFGRFSFRGIVPGSYRVFAFEDLEENIYFDPRFLDNYESRAKPVQIETGSHLTLSLAIPPG